jgi:hypothetical protein
MNMRYCTGLCKLIAVGVLAVGIVVSTGRPASAFTSADADTAVSAYITAFVRSNEDRAFIKADENGGDPGFWQEIENIEGIEDANDRSHGALDNQVSALLNGFVRAHGDDWSWNGFNDDLSWATIAFTRGYEATGNTTFLTIAKNNFDKMYARAWDPAEGALYWTTQNGSYNSCIECPAGIASYLLSQALYDPSYMKKAQDLFAWEKANLFNATTGAVYDALNKNGSLGRWSSSYNQGTFIGLANFMGDIPSAKLAADYTMNRLGREGAGGYLILPEYGAGSGNNSGFNSICLRWTARFMRERGLENEYLGWLQANANAAWNVRRTSDNLSWCQWFQQTPGEVQHSWDCIDTVVALQVTPPDQKAIAP